MAPRYNAVVILGRPLKAYGMVRQRKQKSTRVMGEIVRKLETNLGEIWEVSCAFRV